MDQSIVVPPDIDDPEAVFRRVMAGAADIVWELGYDDEAVSALQGVIEYATIQREAGENRRGDLSE